MLDVVPPNPSRKRSDPSRDSREGGSVVEVEWKLPSRLRRPVRDELARQRKLRARRKSIVQFDRKPLYAKSAVDDGEPTVFETVNRGAERHTGDVYRTRRPQLGLGMPPYAGGFVRQKAAPSPKPVSRRVRRRKPTGKKEVQAIAPQKRAVNRKQKTQRPHMASALPVAGERDVPYAFGGQKLAVKQQVQVTQEQEEAQVSETKAAVTQPEKRFAMPLHFSIWPGSSRKKKE